MSEIVLASLLCSFLNGGSTEVPAHFNNLGVDRHVRIDCETNSHVIEIGLDNTRSARDSLHQAVFSKLVTGKIPMIIIIDTDGKEDRYQQEIRLVAEEAAISFGVCKQGFIEAWAATSPFRSIGNDKLLNDLPQNAAYQRDCDLGPDFEDLK